LKIAATLHHMNTPKSFSNDRMLSLAAFLISIGTFMVYIYEARLLQKQQYASALPYLELVNSSGADYYRLILVNNGIGPAFISDVRVHYKDKVFSGDHVNFYEKNIYPTDTIHFAYANIGPGRVIPAGKEVELITISNSKKDAAKLRKLFGNQTARLEVTYSSVYEETWQLRGITGMSDTPRKIDD